MKKAAGFAAVAAAVIVAGARWQRSLGSAALTLSPAERRSLRDTPASLKDKFGVGADNSFVPTPPSAPAPTPVMTLAPQSGAPKTAPYEGLPDDVSSRLPEEDGYIQQDPLPGSHNIGGMIDISFERAAQKMRLAREDDVRGGPQRAVLFNLTREENGMPPALYEKEWARLPDGGAIRREGSGGGEIWHYPKGTSFIHEVFAKADDALIELRLEQKMEDDAGSGQSGARWGFGIYVPETPNAGRLKLFKQKAGEKRSAPADFPLPLPGGLGNFTWTYHDVYDCRGCHMATTARQNLYRDDEHAGPGGFIPANPFLSKWARDYVKKHPRSVPFTPPLQP